jgi:hypothetical protein
MDERTRPIFGRVLLASATLLAVFGGASLAGWLPIEEPVARLVGIVLLLCAIAEGMVALFFMTRS